MVTVGKSSWFCIISSLAPSGSRGRVSLMANQLWNSSREDSFMYSRCHGHTDAFGFIQFPSRLFLIPFTQQYVRQDNLRPCQISCENLANVVLILRFLPENRLNGFSLIHFLSQMSYKIPENHSEIFVTEIILYVIFFLPPPPGYLMKPGQSWLQNFTYNRHSRVFCDYWIVQGIKIYIVQKNIKLVYFYHCVYITSYDYGYVT